MKIAGQRSFFRTPHPWESLRRWMKSRTPSALQDTARVILDPFRRIKRLLTRELRLWRVLPSGRMRKQFRTMLQASRKEWLVRDGVSTHEEIMLPLSRKGGEVWVRKGTSDVIVYSDVIIDQQYGYISVPDTAALTIIDCGANIGITAAYYLDRFPLARLIGIEPDPVNYEHCCRNLARFGSRAIVLQAAIWGSPSQLVLSEPKLMGTWASRVVPTSPVSDEKVIEGIDLNELLNRFELERVDILKMDIEGAEHDVFANGDLSWMDRVHCIQIELESPESTTAFYRALDGRDFVVTHCQDVVIATRYGR